MALASCNKRASQLFNVRVPRNLMNAELCSTGERDRRDDN